MTAPTGFPRCFSIEDSSRDTVTELIVLPIPVRVYLAYIGSFLWRNAQLIKSLQHEEGQLPLTR